MIWLTILRSPTQFLWKLTYRHDLSWPTKKYLRDRLVDFKISMFAVAPANDIIVNIDFVRLGSNYQLYAFHRSVE